MPSTSAEPTAASAEGKRIERKSGASHRPGAGSTLAALSVERALPNSKEAEVGVLGAILLKPEEAGAIAQDRLTVEHFYYAPHQVIFREMLELLAVTRTLDSITLAQRLQDKHLLEEIGGVSCLAELYTAVPSLANLDLYLDIVGEKYLLRQLIAAGADIVTRCFEQQDDVRAWVDEVEQQVFQITAERTQTGARPVKDLIKDAMGSIEQLYDNRGALSGLATGFRDLDRLTAGLHDGNMIVIAARPSMGKTALAINIAEHVAIDLQLPVAVFSLEMSSPELVTRLLCSRAKVNLRSVRDGFLGEKDFHPLTAAASQLMKAPLFIDDTAGLTIHQVRARARRLKSQYKIRLVVIDYLQLMRAPSRRADGSRQQEISDISSGVKSMAKELMIPVLVLSQLNRQPEAREGGQPRLAALRESGSIEQDADVVGLLVRPEMYEEDAEQKKAKEGEATLIIAKQRNGPTGEVELTFQKEFTRFVDRAKVDPGDLPESPGSDE